MIIPHTYSEWITVLNVLKSRENDEEAYAAMQQGTIEWQSGVAERFAQKLIDVVNFRMDVASDEFQKN